MKRIKNSLAARLTFWILALSILPILITAIFTRALIIQPLEDLISVYQLGQAEILAVQETESGKSISTPTHEADIPEKKFSFSLNQDRIYISHPEVKKVGESARDDFSEEILIRILSGGSGSIIDQKTNQIIGYAQVPGKGSVIVTVLNLAEFSPLTHIQITSVIFLGLCLVIISLATGVAIWLNIDKPLRRLTHTAELIGSGNLQEKINTTGLKAELFTLAESLNLMSSKLGGLISGLELNVAELEQTQEAFQESEERFRAIFNNINDSILVCDLEGRIIDINDRTCEIFGYTREEALQQQAGILSMDDPPFTREAVEKRVKMAAGGTPQFFEWKVKNKACDQLWIGLNMRRALIGNHDRLLIVARNITERKRAELVQFALLEISESAQKAHDLEGLLRMIHEVIAEMMPARNCFIALYDPENDLISFPYHADEYDQDDEFWKPRKPSGGLAAQVLKTGNPLLLRMEDEDRLEEGGLAERIGTLSVDWLGVPLKSFDNITFGVLAVQTYTEGVRYTSQDRDLLSLVSAQIGMTVERFHALDALRHSEERYRSLVENLGEGICFVDSREYIIFFNPAGDRIFGAEPGTMIGRNFKEFLPPEQVGVLLDETLKRQQGEKSSYKLDIIRTDGENRTLQVTGAPRFDKMGHFIGTFGIFRDITDDKKAEEALTRAEVRYRQLVEKIRAVTYLDAVDEQSTTLFISPQIVTLSGYSSEEWISDANLWLDIIYPDDRELVYAEHIKTNQLGEDFCQEYRIITRDGRIVWVHDEASLLRNDKGDPEGWHGVIYDITERKWAEEELQNAHRSLAEAYDATIEGWSRALDLRDRETEGHTLRVTEMALQFAQMLGTNNEEMKHVRRGALLHDIGKMGVPDHILQKPGPLNENEWEIMRLHPFYAYQMLSPISYLRPALDIPFCHHEKWNGSGYPRGMKAEEIPLTARMFAIVDVWDALCSDRPYRRAWPEDKVIDYIRTQSGSHFEPKLVDIFFHLIGRNSGPAG